MKVVAGTHVHNADRWIGYAIASVINYVDLVLVGISRQTTDKTREIVSKLKTEFHNKIEVYDNDSCDKTEGGFGAVKTDMIKRCGKLGAKWILNFDHDHIYYDIIKPLVDIAKEAEDLGFEGVKFRQHFIYNGLRTLPLDPEINSKAKGRGYSMFASFFKYTDQVHVTGEVHESVRVKDNKWQFITDIHFAHIGPVMSDWEVVQKELFYAKLNHKIESEEEEVAWLKKCVEIKFFPKCMLDFTARRRLEFPLGLPDIKDVAGGLPAVLGTYINGSHLLDIEWLIKFIRDGMK
ncbi:MAG: hypothetical protein KAX49_12995 [Halanaerobiales bacterium]|nr:hypothetical protein [Halanaerobiales bacterium]